MILTQATIPTLRAAMYSEKLTPVGLIEAHLARIAALDGKVHAFVHVDEEGARSAARAPVAGPLSGIPFAVKDVLDTGDMATEHGSAIFEQWRPRFDAASVAILRSAGAIVLGKTATAEFAGIAPPQTVHPLDPARTPGGSSSGSAAAVAAGMAVFALGTQTGGSVLRPAAFCGVAGFKPTFGLWPVAGMLPAAHSFDTVGVIARSAGDLGIIHSVMMRMAEPDEPVSWPHVALCRTHLWDTVSDETVATVTSAFSALSDAGATISEVAPFDRFATLTECRAVINAFERAGNMAGLAAEEDRFRTQSQVVYERGLAISGGEYVAARRTLELARSRLDEIFGSADVLVAPVVPGVAPEGLESTGDPRLQEIWSMLHCPSVTIPFSPQGRGLPVGVQLIARPYDDDRLLAAARQLERLRPG